ncbi:MAG: hypothetical protein RL291_2027 [Pseudomonadota bacterium]
MQYRSRSLRSALTLITVVSSLAAVPAQAADLDYRTPPSDRYGTAYADPRYADLYGQRERVPPPYKPYAHPGYAPPHVPIPQAPVYRAPHDEYEPRYGYAPPPAYAPPPHAYEPPRRAPGRTAGCLPKQVIERELVADGWRDFHAPEVLNSQEAHIRARRPDGRLFQLRVDRCSGEIIAARPLFTPGYGPQTYGGYGPRTY